MKLTEEEDDALVTFLIALTDDRVRFQRAPFDHPQLFVPNGHPESNQLIIPDSTGKAKDALLQIPHVGRKGGHSLPNFLEK